MSIRCLLVTKALALFLIWAPLALQRSLPLNFQIWIFLLAVGCWLWSENLWWVYLFSLLFHLPLGQLKLILGNLEMVSSSEQMLKVDIVLYFFHVDIPKEAAKTSFHHIRFRVLGYVKDLVLGFFAIGFLLGRQWVHLGSNLVRSGLLVKWQAQIIMLQHLTQLGNLVIGFLDLLSENFLYLVGYLIPLYCFLGRWRLYRLRNVRFYSETDDRSANLDCFCHFWLKFYLTFGKDESSELWEIVFEVETAVFLIVLH